MAKHQPAAVPGAAGVRYKTFPVEQGYAVVVGKHVQMGVFVLLQPRQQQGQIGRIITVITVQKTDVFYKRRNALQGIEITENKPAATAVAIQVKAFFTAEQLENSINNVPHTGGMSGMGRLPLRPAFVAVFLIHNRNVFLRQFGSYIGCLRFDVLNIKMPIVAGCKLPAHCLCR